MLSMRAVLLLAAAAVIAVVVAALLVLRGEGPGAKAPGRAERRFFVRLFYEGCRGSPLLYSDPLMRRNFFKRGEVAAFEIDVSNPEDRDLKVAFFIAPADDPSRLARVHEGVARAGSVTRFSFEVDTSQLPPALYLLLAEVEGRGRFGSNTDPFRSTNLESYPWLLAVLDEPVRWEAPGEGLPRLIVPEGLGVNIHFVAPSPVEERDLDMIAYAGFKLVRMDLFWHLVERERGSYDLSGYRALTEALRRRGVRPLYILDYGNPLYDDGLPPRSEEGRSAFARFAGRAAEEFGAYALWEVWNEPNIAVFWKPQPNVGDYVKLAAAAAAAVKGACPSCTVLAPATSGVDVSFISSAASLGLLDRVDAVSVHPYRDSNPETALGDYERLRAVVKGKAIVCSEWGYPTAGGYGSRVDVWRQAQYAARIYLVNLMAGVPITIIYDWKDDGLSLEDSEQNFGLVSHHVRGPEWFFVKPAWYALYNLNRLLAGLSPAGRLDLGGGAYALRFEGRGAPKIVVWTDGSEREVELNVGAEKVRLVRLFGLEEELEAPGGVLKLRVSGSPVVVEPLG